MHMRVATPLLTGDRGQDRGYEIGQGYEGVLPARARSTPDARSTQHAARSTQHARLTLGFPVRLFLGWISDKRGMMRHIIGKMLPRGGFILQKAYYWLVEGSAGGAISIAGIVMY